MTFPVKDPTIIHAQKRSKNFAMLAALVSLIAILFIGTLVRIAMGH